MRRPTVLIISKRQGTYNYVIADQGAIEGYALLGDSLTDTEHFKFRRSFRRYELWQGKSWRSVHIDRFIRLTLGSLSGRNSFLFHGRLMLGRDVNIFLLTNVVIIVSSISFFVSVLKEFPMQLGPKIITTVRTMQLSMSGLYL